MKYLILFLLLTCLYHSTLGRRRFFRPFPSRRPSYPLSPPPVVYVTARPTPTPRVVVVTVIVTPMATGTVSPGGGGTNEDVPSCQCIARAFLPSAPTCLVKDECNQASSTFSRDACGIQCCRECAAINNTAPLCTMCRICNFAA
eukprot:Plantae.Rhodophyta-Hildenbrandia_rubra.ctg29044.p2 GENE.Plantae.Rhodophyta-Hildenbrandia_rubra.ctg29044~~Plantae.Rhodophyta-Hildenbrandia_rubra.ctg29044.p2  ORF type:complete len:144 (-),score=4.59 Plantae.Rhodophyta-Hildenbrandia_rubra.ctg29044:1202-1633(-)